MTGLHQVPRPCRLASTTMAANDGFLLVGRSFASLTTSGSAASAVERSSPVLPYRLNLSTLPPSTRSTYGASQRDAATLLAELKVLDPDH